MIVRDLTIARRYDANGHRKEMRYGGVMTQIPTDLIILYATYTTFKVDQQNTIAEQALSMLDNGSSKDDILASLLQRGHEERFVRELLGEVMKKRALARRTQGFTLILCGAMICLLSCVATLVSAKGVESLTYALYGGTSLGILVIFAGLTKIF